MSDLCAGANEPGLAQNAIVIAIATTPTTRARADASAASSSSGATITPRYRVIQLGPATKPSRASRIPSTASTISAQIVTASADRRRVATSIGTQPTSSATS